MSHALSLPYAARMTPSAGARCARAPPAAPTCPSLTGLLAGSFVPDDRHQQHAMPKKPIARRASDELPRALTTLVVRVAAVRQYRNANGDTAADPMGCAAA